MNKLYRIIGDNRAVVYAYGIGVDLPVPAVSAARAVGRVISQSSEGPAPRRQLSQDVMASRERRDGGFEGGGSARCRPPSAEAGNDGRQT